VHIPQSGGPTCPVAALKAWLGHSGSVEGALFRRVSKSGKILSEGLSASAVATIVKQHAAQIDLDATCFSGHSLRSGFVTSAAVAGMPLWKIKRQTGHVSDAILGRYIREAEPIIQK
jgi:integrase